ncbi:MAG TPA: cyclase family protein [Coleofasciculaceae cyanobacterium]|jgi:arylformamidase
MMPAFEIIDISQPVSRATACFPGDVPFSRELTLSHADSGVINLCSFTMSPHVGTHADAPVHVRGDLNQTGETIGQLPLLPFIGPALVVDVSPCTEAITWSHVASQLDSRQKLPPRILFRTARQIRYDVFENAYAWFSTDLVTALAARGVILVGLDTPSVDPVDSKTLETHHALLSHGMSWLENLDFSSLTVDLEKPAEFFLVALPLKMMELEASPVRAVLLKPQA